MTFKTKGKLIHISQLKRHPRADIIPHMRKHEWDEFYTDIAMAGIREEIEILADGTIVDGHHRYEAAQKLNIEWLPWKPAPLNGDDPDVYMLKAAVLRRHLTDAQRDCMAALWKQEKKEQGERTDLTSPRHRGEVKTNHNPTTTKTVELFQVTRRGIEEATKFLNQKPEIFSQVHEGKITPREARRIVKQIERDKQIKDAKAKAENSSLPERCNLIHGDFREECQSIPEASIDLIITDPPYGKDYKPLYSDLGLASERLLKNGGSLLVMTGIMYLPEVFSMLNSNLNYNWTIAYLLPTKSSRVFPARVFQGWKPILWFTKGKYTGDWMPDVIYPSGQPEKGFDDWQQASFDFQQLLQYLSPPNGVVLDPMVGWGATAIASLNLDRQFIGIDISEDALLVTKSRLPKTKGDA